MRNTRPSPHLSRLSARLTAQGVNALRPGVHPALQLAYPASGTGAYPTLWNPRQQSQKSCYRSSPRDLQAPRARRGASAAERCGKIDVLSVVRKSRNSSGGFYRCRRRSAHDRSRTNAMRFLMNTLLALSVPQSIHAFWQNSLWMRSGVLLSSCPLRSLAPAIRGYWRGKITALGLLAPVQSSVSKLLLRQYTHPNPFLPSSAPHRSRYFSHTLSNVRGRLRPTVE